MIHVQQICKWSQSHPVVSNSLWPHRLYSPWDSLGQNTGVGSLSLLQGIFPTRGWNPGLPHCRWILYQLSHKGSPRILEWVAYPFSSGSSWPSNQTGVSCIDGGFFTNWATRICKDFIIITYYICISLFTHHIMPLMIFLFSLPKKSIICYKKSHLTFCHIFPKPSFLAMLSWTVIPAGTLTECLLHFTYKSVGHESCHDTQKSPEESTENKGAHQPDLNHLSHLTPLHVGL